MFVYFLPSLEGKLLQFVVLAFEIMQGDVQGLKLDDKQVKEVLMFISLTHTQYIQYYPTHTCVYMMHSANYPTQEQHTEHCIPLTHSTYCQCSFFTRELKRKTVI